MLKLTDLLPDGDRLLGFFELMDKAECIIEQWQARYPDCYAVLYDTFMLAQPTTDTIAANETLWQHHFEELLKRVVNGEDLSLATDAELLCAMSGATLATPIHAENFTMYWRTFKRIFPHKAKEKAKEIEGAASFQEYENYPGYVEEQLTEVRRKFRVVRNQPDPQRWRRLNTPE